MQLKRAWPMPPGIYLATKLVTSMVVVAVVSIALMLMGVIVGKVVLELVQWASVLILTVLARLANGGADMLPHVIDQVGMAALFLVVATARAAEAALDSWKQRGRGDAS
jgi:hypothetical protein